MNERRDRDAASSRRPNIGAISDGYKDHLDERLDEALKETFPASDPIAVTPRRRNIGPSGSDVQPKR